MKKVWCSNAVERIYVFMQQKCEADCSRDKGNPQYHKANNVSNSEVTHYQIDGKVIKTGDRCDYLLMNETSKTAYLIELKGSDLVKAASQLEATENALRSQLVEYQLQYRIVANKCKTQEIHSSAYRKYQIRWKSRLLQKTGYIEEKIQKIEKKKFVKLDLLTVVFHKDVS